MNLAGTRPITLHSRGEIARRRRYLVIKRIMDLAICIFFLPVLLPLMAIIAIAIKQDTPGPVFFVRERIGRGGKPFPMYKFRTMYHDHNDEADRSFMQAYVAGNNVAIEDVPTKPRFKPNNLNRITRVGAFLRKTSLDEIPQIFNVLRGEMSLVGPRPNVPWEVEVYQGWHTERLEVLPGITGLAQVKGRSDINFDTLVRYDLKYIRKQCLQLDLKIMLETFLVIFSGKGAG